MLKKNIPFHELERHFENPNFKNQFIDILTNQKYLQPSENRILEFKKYFTNFINHDYVLPTSTGTSALHLSMCAIDLKRGDRVLCSVDSFASIPEVVRHFDAEPLFVDIDEKTLHMDIDKLEATIKKNYSKKLRAIIVHHIGGDFLDMKRIKKLADEYELYIIEDATALLGSSNAGINTYSDVKIFRFDANHKDSFANGGALVSNNRELYKKAKLLAYHGIAFDDLQDTNTVSLDYVYDLIDIGCEYGMSELEATYHMINLRNAQETVKKRREIAKIYFNKLKKSKHITFIDVQESSTFYYFTIKVDKNRDDFARELKQRGIFTGLYYPPLHLMTYYKSKYELKVNDFPSALRAYQQVLNLPIYQSMTKEEAEFICDSIIEIAKDRV